jgi:dTDP-4-dehydrorhamnose reductase
VTATSRLAQAAKQHGAFFLYISTDYVFPGVKGEAPYHATSKPSPSNIYGQTKLDGEEATSNHGGTILRVPVLYGPTEDNSESAVNVLMDALYKSQKEPVKMDDWALRYPTNTEDVARVCVDIARHKAKGILQFSSEDRMTKYEICSVFGEIMGLPVDGFEPDREGGKAKDGTVRPYDCHLDTSGLKDLGIDVSTVDFVAWWRRKVGAFRH